MSTKAVALSLILCAAPLVAGDDDVLVIRAGRVIPVAGPELVPGTIVLKAGKVEAVGRRVETPEGARVLDLPELTVMPALVDPRSRFGLGASYDRGGNHADLSVAPEVDPSRARFRPLLGAGFACVGLFPAGGGIPGQAVGLVPDEGAREALLIPGAGYLRVRFTSLPGDKQALREALTLAKAAIDREDQARKAFEEKQKASTAPVATPTPAAASAAPVASPAVAEFKPPAISPELRPWVALLRGKDAPRVVVELARASDALHFEEAWARVPGKQRPAGWVLDAGTSNDLYLLVEGLGKEKALVACAPRLSIEPNTRTRRNLPLELTKAGARVALLAPDDAITGHRRVLEALTVLVKDGLSREAALAGVTRWPAALLGLGDRGTIEPGKRADLVFLDGDPLLPGTRVDRVFLAGREAWRRGAEEAGDEE